MSAVDPRLPLEARQRTNLVVIDSGHNNRILASGLLSHRSRSFRRRHPSFSLPLPPLKRDDALVKGQLVGTKFAWPVTFGRATVPVDEIGHALASQQLR